MTSKSRCVPLPCLLLLLAGLPLRASVFSDIATHIRQKNERAAVGIGKAVGVKLGAVVETATMPALDNAATRFSEVAKGAADRIDESLKVENQSIDEIARTNIGRLDVLAQTRLDQTGQLIDERLLRVERDANSILNREAAIIDDALKQERTIANQSLDRLQNITDSSLDRIQNIEGDALNRVDSALQDEVPVAASQVAHEFVVAAVVVLCIAALFGFAGISLWRNMRTAMSDDTSTWQALKAALAGFWRTLPRRILTVVLPTILVCGAILAGYETYLRTTRAMRVTRLEKAATLLESAGEYKVAADLRRRAAAIDATDGEGKTFAYQTDLWLADFTQAHAIEPGDLLARLASLQNNKLSEANGDLAAAALFLHAVTEGQFDGAAGARYEQKFLQGKSAAQIPFLGKLVLMGEIQAELDRGGAVATRIEPSLKRTEQLRNLYPKYANGHLLAAMLKSMQADDCINGSKQDPKRAAELRTEASGLMEQAEALDPGRLRIARLNAYSLPADLVKDLDEHPRNGGVGARLAEVTSREIAPLARAVLASNRLTEVAVERTTLRAMRRGIGELRITHTIAAVQAEKGVAQRAALMVSAAQQLYDLDEYLAAESWAGAAQETLAGRPDANPALVERITSFCNALKQVKISDALPAVM